MTLELPIEAIFGAWGIFLITWSGNKLPASFRLEKIIFLPFKMLLALNSRALKFFERRAIFMITVGIIMVKTAIKITLVHVLEFVSIFSLLFFSKGQ